MASGPPFASFPPGADHLTYVDLSDGGRMPLFGLGVYKSAPGRETEDAVLWALEAGYRMVDTASLYHNEASVGAALRASGLPREEVFVTTKLWDDDHGYEAAIAACEASLSELGLGYVDLYLIHSPNTGKLVETWDALLELQRRGRVRSVGVSNFGVPHLEALKQHGRAMPVVNQIEMHPMNFQERLELLQYCKANSILVQAYGSLFAGETRFLSHPKLEKVCSECGKTASQVLLRWAHQMGFAIIPKSTRKPRIVENMSVFDFALSPAQMDAVSSISGRLGCYWQPLRAAVDLGDTRHGSAAL